MSKFKQLVILILSLLVIAVVVTHCSSHESYAEIVPNPTANLRVNGITNAEKYWLNEEALEIAWPMLREAGYSEVATAAILGNLHYESRMYPTRYENFTPEESVPLSEYRKTPRNRFIYSSGGYGLAGWTGATNKARLWDFCNDNDYDLQSVEGQIAFLIEDYPAFAEASYIRMSAYEVEDIVTAAEDFRQSYEKSSMDYQSQYSRAKLAKLIFATYCEDIYDIPTVNKAPMEFNIYQKINALNTELGLKRKGEK